MEFKLFFVDDDGNEKPLSELTEADREMLAARVPKNPIPIDRTQTQTMTIVYNSDAAARLFHQQILWHNAMVVLKALNEPLEGRQT